GYGGSEKNPMVRRDIFERYFGVCASAVRRYGRSVVPSTKQCSLHCDATAQPPHVLFRGVHPTEGTHTWRRRIRGQIVETFITPRTAHSQLRLTPLRFRA